MDVQTENKYVIDRQMDKWTFRIIDRVKKFVSLCFILLSVIKDVQITNTF